MKNSILTFKRRLLVAHRAYDGRFTSKRVEDKKKVASKRACRKKVKIYF